MFKQKNPVTIATGFFVFYFIQLRLLQKSTVLWILEAKPTKDTLTGQRG